jgi:integrase
MSGEADTAPEATAVICAYRPHAVSENAGAFARQVVAKARPSTPARSKALLFAASRLAAFGESVGLELQAEVLLHPAVIERFIVAGERTFSVPTRRTLRTNLRHLARRLAAHPHPHPHPQPEPTPLPRERSKPPYSEAEIAGYLALAAAQPTRARQMRATALICLGAGAGLIGQELRHITGQDVIRRSGGLVVVVGSRRARTVPVLARFHSPLQEAVSAAGQRFLLGGSDPARRNLTDALCRCLSADASLPRFQAGRLRATWLAQCAAQIGLHAFMAAAGVSCSQWLGDIAQRLPAPSEAELVALLGGSR